MSAPWNRIVVKICLAVAVAAMRLLALTACGPSSIVSVSMSGCPTSTPGTPVYQSQLRPQVPEYPDAQNIQIATPVPPESSFETPAINNPPTAYWLTKKLTRFVTADAPQEVLAFYSDSLTKEGWSVEEGTPSQGSVIYWWTVAGTVSAASRTDPCAPTPEHGLPWLGIEIKIVGTGEGGTIVEVIEGISGGY